MASITEIRKKIPQDLLNSFYDIFDIHTVDKILYGFSEKKLTTLRVNTLKYDIKSLMDYFKQINIKFERVKWNENALILKNADERDLEKLNIYKDGLIYLQNLSSMIPPIILDPQEGEKILDVAAAPGSKTTQMAAMMKNRGFILANEVDKIRAERLKYNLNLQGVEIAEVRVGKGERIGDEYTEFFDKVLLDVPCSGEGIISIKDSKTYKGWSLKEVEKLSRLQKKLFESAYKALKKGGIIVYSTCTLNRKENEEIIDWAINHFNIDILSIERLDNNFLNGITTGLNDEVKKCIRVIPNDVYEGFFVCKIKKKD
ncbi:MAG: RsmB/NOP family class I SAM-dependent RNA methyltransferase [Caloramator sp.]|nr:RsmB/NOP family class I SAM-dependent RNA methyltransferase [Caloramator sp.]